MCARPQPPPKARGVSSSAAPRGGLLGSAGVARSAPAAAFRVHCLGPLRGPHSAAGLLMRPAPGFPSSLSQSGRGFTCAGQPDAMYYKFSSFTQNLIGVAAAAAYNPQVHCQACEGLFPPANTPMGRSICPTILAFTSYAWYLEGLKPLVSTKLPAPIFEMPTKVDSESPAAVSYLGRNKVPELQKLFQKADGVLVHLKQGVPDQLLYRTTMALTIGGSIYCLIALYMASQPKNQK